jgi:adenylate kinase family enzyme
MICSMGTPRRIAVVGNSGSGKTTFATEVAARLGCEHVELDGIHHLENWTPIERDRMRNIVAERMQASSWVVDGNYRSLVQDLVFVSTDTVVWLDLPRWLVMSRVVRRTLGRMLLHRELWNGNRERLSNLFSTNPEENIILWSWTQHEKYRAQYETARRDPANRHLAWVRVTSPRRQREWLAGLR